jgi:hypothetical protein
MPANLGTTATIISLFPFEIFERKPLIPSIYRIEAATEEGQPKILVIQDGRFYVYLDEYRGSMTIRTPAITIAESVVRDFLDGQFVLDVDARPAIWTIPGEWSIPEILTDKSQKERIEKENAVQLAWFKRLVMIAEDEWAKFKQHRMISDMQRVAGQRLKLTNRDWMVEMKPENLIDCPGCGVTLHKKVAVCRECGCVIDPVKYKTLQFVSEQKAG